MAVGARGRDILAQFLVEAVTLSAVGGLIGVGIGVLTSVIIANLAEWSTDISVQSVGLAFAFAGVVGVFFGFYPAQKAARLDPIDALRYE
jgi:putative ABC transport system permease protein